MSGLDGWIVTAALAGLSAWYGLVKLLPGWVHHWRHAAHVTRLPPVIVGDGDPRFGSMCLTEEQVIHHELPVTPRRVRTPDGMLLEYDWSGRYEVIETAPGHPLRRPELPPWAADERIDATLADLGLEAAPAAPSPDQDLGGGVGTADTRDGDPVTSPEPPTLAGDTLLESGLEEMLGPRGRAVLARYEDRRGDRRWALS